LVGGEDGVGEVGVVDEGGGVAVAPLKPGDRLELGPCAFAVNREALDPLP
jgi:hypothetical protein